MNLQLLIRKMHPRRPWLKNARQCPGRCRKRRASCLVAYRIMGSTLGHTLDAHQRTPLRSYPTELSSLQCALSRVEMAFMI